MLFFTTQQYSAHRIRESYPSGHEKVFWEIRQRICNYSCLAFFPGVNYPQMAANNESVRGNFLLTDKTSGPFKGDFSTSPLNGPLVTLIPRDFSVLLCANYKDTWHTSW